MNFGINIALYDGILADYCNWSCW